MHAHALTPLESHAVIAILSSVLGDRMPVDRATAQELKQLDCPFSAHVHIVDSVSSILRRLNLVAFLANIQLHQAVTRLPLLLCTWHRLERRPLPNLREASDCPAEPFAARLKEAQAMPALWDGCPDWLDTLGQQQLGEQWPAERQALSLAPTRFIRVNTLKTQASALIQRLKQNDISAEQVANMPDTLKITSDGSLFRTDAFQDGWFEQQDAGSQTIAPFLQVKPGMRVIDACAGAGGKTLHLAALTQGRGRLLAMDVEEWKLENLKQRARRAGAFNIETRLIKNGKTIKRLKDSADRLLLDVPCSGLGVLKRNPDTKWRDTEARLTVLIELQADILQKYSQMVKTGGQLVYSTCSLLPMENEQQVTRFLTNNPSFRLIQQQNISPAATGFDGFYMALLEKQS